MRRGGEAHVMALIRPLSTGVETADGNGMAGAIPSSIGGRVR